MKAGVQQVVVLLAAVLHAGSSVGVTPLQKAVQLLEGMAEAGKEEMHQERLQYAVFEQFCIGTTAEKKRIIEEADLQLEVLAAEVLKHNTEADRLAAEILGHQAKMTSLQNDSEVAAAVHAEERKEYLAMHQNYSESIHALTQAIATLKKQAYAGVSDGAFLARGSEEPDDLQFVTAPERQYEFKSGEVVKMLEQLLDKFRNELAALEKEELESGHAYTMLAQNLKNGIAMEDSMHASKTKTKLKHQQQLIGLEADQNDVATARADDALYLQDLESTCQRKEEEYQTRQDLRSKELEVIEKAVAILTSEEVAATAAKHLPSLLQPGNGGSLALAQLRSAGDGASLLRAADFLRDESKRLDSHVLSTIAMHARQDPFAKVKQLIEELITRLMMQATRESEHKGWCDTELATNAHTRTSKSQQVEDLTTEIDSLEAAIAQLQKDAALLTAAVADIDAEVKEATSIRNQEKAHNANTTLEAQQAQASMGGAITLLEDFYRAAKANATALLSQKASGPVQLKSGRQEPPPIWGDEPYLGQQAGSGGVVAMMRVIQSDFARLESKTAMAEDQAAKAHKVFMTDSLVAKAQKTTSIKHKNTEKDNKEITLMDKERALEDAQNLLAGALKEYEQLKPACLSEGQTYEERVQRREEEIEALKKALEILSGDFGL